MAATIVGLCDMALNLHKIQPADIIYIAFGRYPEIVSYTHLLHIIEHLSIIKSIASQSAEHASIQVLV